MRRATPGERHASSQQEFLSTLSLRRATHGTALQCVGTPAFLSTLSLRRATKHQLRGGSRQRISIHALLAESDDNGRIRDADNLTFLSTLSLRRATIVSVGLLMYNLYFYPRSPCGERPILKVYGYGDNKFLSTLSLRRATISCALPASKLGDFYPRSPCGERPYIIRHAVNLHPISIHALLAESDMQVVIVIVHALISIHALLAESDQRT